MRKIKDHSLYLVISEEYCKGRNAFEIAEAAIKGGVDIIQMREKNKAREELLDIGRGLSRLCRNNGVIFIVNDDPILAKEVDADGVHLGQEDILRSPVNKIRKMIGKNKIIGVSTHSVEQFKRASEEDLDYMAFGPIFETKTKNYSIGIKDIGAVLNITQKPVFCIGGINLSNIDVVLNEGATNVALIRGITEADDITSRTREFAERIQYAGKDKRKERMR